MEKLTSMEKMLVKCSILRDKQDLEKQLSSITSHSSEDLMNFAKLKDLLDSYDKILLKLQ